MTTLQSPLTTPSRRGFLLGAAATGSALLIGFRPGATVAQTSASLNPLEVFLRIDDDSTVTVLSAHMDMGQGCYHGLATLVVEELGCAWDQIDVVGASGNAPAYGNKVAGGQFQFTGGSTAMFSSWDRYRTAGAAARMMLIRAAAQDWQVVEDEVVISSGMLTHAASGRSATLGEFSAAAAALPVPQDIVLKQPSEWTEIGAIDTKRYDRAGKTDGTEMFTQDLQFEGMLTAVPIHPPRFGARLVSFDAAEALALDGVVDVVAMPRGLSVVANDTWTAMQARDLVTAEWDESEAETRGSEQILEDYREIAVQSPDIFARSDGDVAAAMENAAQIVEATYTFPYLCHAALEPLNAVAERDADGRVVLWGGHQAPDGYRFGMAEFLQMDPANIDLRIMKTGGGFGRRGVHDGDVVLEATATAQALGWQTPVKMQWRREDDMMGGRYRPAVVHHIRAGLDASGNIVAWQDHIVGQSINIGTAFESGSVHGGVDHTSVEGARELPYQIPNLTVGVTYTDVKVPVLWWRAVGHTHTAYTNETFLDKIAAETGQDPIALRLSLLDPGSRQAEALSVVANMADWNAGAPSGRHRGVAVHESFGSVVAHIAEISVDEDGNPKVHKVWCAVNCGIAVNPDTVIAQMEGSIGFGLGAILDEEITLTDGYVDQSNYDGYTPLRIDQMPDIEVTIIPSENGPTGVGEPAVPPIGPAVANAYCAATGRSIERLPFSRSL